eukprot:CAMPEP_0204912784 /NCGR_PEP_ID=MMETSP1397-20131031/10882_1 /ASSEMBLY_ACC=CAM_ASM_000891 /TAXON_ID=49980 /ORGANISM="Climacostomum Climacostomum virens, Strain Stock W-24" /LENGTH=536 /DNA_ID=CAMNT_0052083881 /DNA_START=63 /DNA_END=1673 /DNA_ORIENTATION=-
MRSLREQAQILIGMPLKQQILRTISKSEEPAGLTVHDVSKKLCLNTKTCAKVLEEMSASNEGVKATGYRYGRVYMFKYSLDLKEEVEQPDTNEYVAAVDEQLFKTLNEMPSSLKDNVKKALLVASHDDTKGNSRMRVTHQTFLRALFILHCLSKDRVLSVHELKRMIKDELEPNIKWSLDKRTVLRIVWKLQRLQFLRQMCFRIRLSREDKNDVEFLGDDYQAIEEDKKKLGLDSQYDSEGCLVVYRILITLPEINEDTVDVRGHASLINPTNRQPMVGGETFKKLHLFSTSLHSKALKQIVSKMNLAAKRVKGVAETEPENITELLFNKAETLEVKEEGQGEDLTTEVAKAINSAYRQCVFVKWLDSFFDRALTSRYYAFFNKVRVSTSYTVLKRLLKAPQNVEVRDPISEYIDDGFSPLQIACKSLHIKPKAEIPKLKKAKTVEMSLIHTEKPSKITCEFAKDRIRKMLAYFSSRPVGQNASIIEGFTKNLDVDLQTLLQGLEDIGTVSKNAFGDYVLTSRMKVLSNILNKPQQ